MCVVPVQQAMSVNAVMPAKLQIAEGCWGGSNDWQLKLLARGVYTPCPKISDTPTDKLG